MVLMIVALVLVVAAPPAQATGGRHHDGDRTFENGWTNPVAGATYDDSFGRCVGRRWWRRKVHLGVDARRLDRRADVLPLGDGEVVATRWWRRAGKAVAVLHEAVDGTRFVAVYGHLRTDVSPGDAVEAGTPFARLRRRTFHLGIRPLADHEDPDDVVLKEYVRCRHHRWTPPTRGFVPPLRWLAEHPPPDPGTGDPVTGSAGDELLIYTPPSGNGDADADLHDIDDSYAVELIREYTRADADPDDRVVAVDVDGDGVDEVLVYTSPDSDGGDATATLFDAAADGSPAVLGTATRNGASPDDIVVALDADGDGADEVLVYRPQTSGPEGHGVLFDVDADLSVASRTLYAFDDAPSDRGAGVIVVGYDGDGNGVDEVIVYAPPPNQGGAGMGGVYGLTGGPQADVVVFPRMPPGTPGDRLVPLQADDDEDEEFVLYRAPDSPGPVTAILVDPQPEPPGPPGEVRDTPYEYNELPVPHIFGVADGTPDDVVVAVDGDGDGIDEMLVYPLPGSDGVTVDARFYPVAAAKRQFGFLAPLAAWERLGGTPRDLVVPLDIGEVAATP